MNRFFYWCTGVLLLLLQDAAAQQSFQVSGTATQPHVCMQQVNGQTGGAAESVGSCLYLLNGDAVAEFPVAGRYTAQGSTTCFEPLYPLGEGQRFLLRAPGYRDTIITTPPRAIPVTGAPGVVSFYPMTDSIPENILFFHIRFTQAMEEDREAWKKVSVTDEQGKLIPRTWRQRSFWLDSGRLLVLMIHPGRVKSGIHYTGPVFIQGHTYTIAVDSTMADSYGRHLKTSVRHHYYILPERRERLQACKVTRSLESGTRTPVQITFCNGVDHGAAITGIFLYDAAGKPLPCTIRQDEEYTVSVQPGTPWPKGKLRLELTGDLYDCAGNRLNRLFEMKRSKTYRKDRLSESFRINAE
jgi:hypothetical protein